jgi:hypothetical protein
MDDLSQSLDSDAILPAKNWRLGRRKGDAILLAWNYARERGDLEVAEQLRLEYEKKINELPSTMSVDRRKKVDSIHNALSDFWIWLIRP